MKWKGGEKAANDRLEYYTKNCIKKYDSTRWGLLGADYSSKLSAWIANGSISVRYVYRRV